MKTIRIRSTLEMSKEEWLLSRQEGIGGSDIGAIIGVNKWSSPLRVYLSKKEPPREIEDENSIERMFWGNALEDVVARTFAERMNEEGKDFKVTKSNATWGLEEIDWARASLDRLIYSKERGRGILEVKTTSAYGKDEWENSKVPDSYMAQLQWYMGILNIKWGYFAVLIGGQKLLIKEVEFDQEIFDNLLEAGKDFWENNILKNNMPAPSGNDTDETWVKEQTGSSDSRYKIEELSGATDEQIKDWLEKKELEKAVIKERKAVEQQIKLKFGTAEKMLTNLYELTYKTDVKGARRFKVKERK